MDVFENPLPRLVSIWTSTRLASSSQICSRTTLLPFTLNASPRQHHAVAPASCAKHLREAAHEGPEQVRMACVHAGQRAHCVSQCFSFRSARRR